VAEAMLVGEERPYCVALLWLKVRPWTQAPGHLIDRLVSQVNHGLSHPEQVKRWAVLANDLSIEAGDLTANLKLKRRRSPGGWRMSWRVFTMESAFSSRPAYWRGGEG